MKKMEFEAKVSKMGHKRMINVPSKQPGFKPGKAVTVKEMKGK